MSSKVRLLWEPARVPKVVEKMPSLNELPIAPIERKSSTFPTSVLNPLVDPPNNPPPKRLPALISPGATSLMSAYRNTAP